MNEPTEPEVSRFLEETAIKALNRFADELGSLGQEADVTAANDRVRIEVAIPDDLEFVYSIVARPGEEAQLSRAEVYLGEGGQHYDVMGWSEERLIDDLLAHYEKHKHYLHLKR